MCPLGNNHERRGNEHGSFTLTPSFPSTKCLPRGSQANRTHPEDQQSDAVRNAGVACRVFSECLQPSWKVLHDTFFLLLLLLLLQTSCSRGRVRLILSAPFPPLPFNVRGLCGRGRGRLKRREATTNMAIACTSKGGGRTTSPPLCRSRNERYTNCWLSVRAVFGFFPHGLAGGDVALAAKRTVSTSDAREYQPSGEADWWASGWPPLSGSLVTRTTPPVFFPAIKMRKRQRRGVRTLLLRSAG